MRIRTTAATLAALTLAAAGTVAVQTAVAAPATASTAECSTYVMGQSATDRVHVRAGSGDVVTETAHSTPQPWRAENWVAYGGAGDANYAERGYLVATTDGALRQVTTRHSLDTDTLRVDHDRVVTTGWDAAHTAGTRTHLYTVGEDGTVSQYRVLWRDNAAYLGSSRVLPWRLPDTGALATAEIAVDGGVRHVLYSTDSRTGALRQAVFSPGSAEAARLTTLASAGYGDLTSLAAETCWDPGAAPTGQDVNLVGVVEPENRAYRTVHRDALVRSGATLEALGSYAPDARWGWKLLSLG